MEEKNKNKFRSTAYPFIPLDEAINELEKVRTNLGKGTYSRESIAHALGYNGLNGAAVRKVAALVHYGLVERGGKTYKYSALSDRILFPVDEGDKANAIVEAALTPKLYNSLVQRYAESTVPSMLENILIQQYKISDQVSKSASIDFKSTMEFAGLLRDNVLHSAIEDSSVVPEQHDNKEDQGDLDKEKLSYSNGDDIKLGYTKLPALPSGIIISFPEDLAPFASLGRFSDGLNLLEEKAKEIRKKI